MFNHSVSIYFRGRRKCEAGLGPEHGFGYSGLQSLLRHRQPQLPKRNSDRHESDCGRFGFGRRNDLLLFRDRRGRFGTRKRFFGRGRLFGSANQSGPDDLGDSKPSHCHRPIDHRNSVHHQRFADARLKPGVVRRFVGDHTGAEREHCV